MLLAIDIGNTNITFGIFEHEQILESFRLESDKTASVSNYRIWIQDLMKEYKITDCIIGSVVEELSTTIKSAVDGAFGINSLVLSSELKLGIDLKIQNPKEAGADRIANACGALRMYSKPAIVVDLGTATTFDIINENGDFAGGVIMPGLNLQFKSLSSNTSKLPWIDAKTVDKAIGNSTADAILSGVVRGSACAIEGLIEQCEKELAQKPVIIATGGYSTLISKYMTRKFDYVNPNLTLEGLRILYEMNKK